MIEQWFIIISSLLIGYALGSKQNVIAKLEQIKKEIEKKSVKSGVIRRPPAAVLNKPKIIKDEEDAMSETLRQIPELNDN